MPLIYNPSGEEDRCGFNILTQFFFGEQQNDSIWNYGEIKPIDIVILTTQIFHHKIIPTRILSGEKMVVDQTTIGRGIEFDPLCLFMRMFSNYSQINRGLPMKWEMLTSSPGTMCAGNSEVAVLYGDRKDVGETTFTLEYNHWVLYSKSRVVSNAERKIRLEFIINAFMQAVTSFGNLDFKTIFDLAQVGKLVNQYFNSNSRKNYSVTNVMEHIFDVYKKMRMLMTNSIVNNHGIFEININESTQKLVAYLSLRAAVNYHQFGGMAYNLQEPYTYIMDDEYRNIVRSGMSEQFTATFKRTLELIPNGCTNFLNTNPIHNLFYADSLVGLSQVDFMLALYKRVTGYKTLLEKSKLIAESGLFHTGVKFLKERNLVLSGAIKFNPKGDLSVYLVDPTKLFVDLYTSVGLGESFYKTAGNQNGRLAHVKLLVSVWIHTLNRYECFDTYSIVERYSDPKNELTKMKDTAFLEAFSDISTIEFSSDRDFSVIPYRDRLAENLRISGLFEFARTLGSSVSYLRNVVSKSHLRMSLQNAMRLILDEDDIFEL